MALALCLLLLFLWPQLSHAGWGNSKGSGWNQSWQGRGYHHNSGRFGSQGGKGSLADVAFVLDALHQTSSRRKRTRSRSSSRSPSPRRRSRGSSSSSSLHKELEELRRYKEESEAAAAATREAEKKKTELEAREAEFKRMEQRILQALPSPAKKTVQRGATEEAGRESPLSTLAARFIESLTDQHVSSEGLCSWEAVEQRLFALDSSVLREILTSHSEIVPRSKSQRVSKLVEFLSKKCAPWTGPMQPAARSPNTADRQQNKTKGSEFGIHLETGICLLLGFLCFLAGLLVGAATCPAPETFGCFGWAVTYGRALRTIAWDYSGQSMWLQRVTGCEIYSASTALAVFLSSSAMALGRSWLQWQIPRCLTWFFWEWQCDGPTIF